MPDSLSEQLYAQLRSDIKNLQGQINSLTGRTERAEYTDGIPAYVFVDLPTTGLADGTTYITLAWVSNGRKSGEGAGNGTGVLAIYNAAGTNWLRVGEDYAAVTI